MSAIPQLQPDSYPIHLGTKQQFSRLRELLAQVGYVQENMEGHFRLRHVGAAEFEVEPRATEKSPSFAVLAALVLQGKSFECATAQDALGRELVGLLSGLGRIGEARNRRCDVRGALCPTIELYDIP